MSLQNTNAQVVPKNVFPAIVLLIARLAIPNQPHHYAKAANASTNACPAEPQSSLTATMSAKNVIHRVWNVKRENQRIAKHAGLIKLCSCLVPSVKRIRCERTQLLQPSLLPSTSQRGKYFASLLLIVVPTSVILIA